MKIERIEFAARKLPRRQEGKTTSRLTARFLSPRPRAFLSSLREKSLAALPESTLSKLPSTTTSQLPKGSNLSSLTPEPSLAQENPELRAHQDKSRANRIRQDTGSQQRLAMNTR